MKIIQKLKNWFNVARENHRLRRDLKHLKWQLSEAKESRYRKAHRSDDMLNIVEGIIFDLRCKKDGRGDCIHRDLPSDQSITAMQWNTHIEELIGELQKVKDAWCPYTNKVEAPEEN